MSEIPVFVAAVITPGGIRIGIMPSAFVTEPAVFAACGRMSAKRG